MPVTVILAAELLPRLQSILADLDAWYAATKTLQGTDTRIDQVAAGLADLIAEVAE